MSTERSSTIYVKEHFDHPLVVAEIGVWEGENALNLLSMNLERIFFIDSYRAYKRYTQAEMDAAMVKASDRIAPCRKASFLRMESVKAAAMFPDGYFDYVYIDGDHTLAAVALDLEMWWPKVKAGGIFAGHDYSASVGVMRAVDQFCAQRKLGVRTWAMPRTADGPEHLADWLIVKKD